MSLSASVAIQAAQAQAQYALKLPDAARVVTALDMGAATLVTHDRDFSSVSELPMFHGPQDPGQAHPARRSK